MTITWLVIAFAALVAGVLSFAWLRNLRMQFKVRRASKKAERPAEQKAAPSAIPVDLDAFRTLMDRDDESFLRERLSSAKFRHLKRQRIVVTLKYVSRISGNIPMVLRDAQLKSESPDPEVVQLAVRTTDLAIEIRRQCLVMYARLAAEYALPSLQLTPVALVPGYQTLRESVNRLRTLQAQKPALQALAI